MKDKLNVLLTCNGTALMKAVVSATKYLIFVCDSDIIVH